MPGLNLVEEHGDRMRRVEQAKARRAQRDLTNYFIRSGLMKRKPNNEVYSFKDIAALIALEKGCSMPNSKKALRKLLFDYVDKKQLDNAPLKPAPAKTKKPKKLPANIANTNFYYSDEWRDLRYRTLIKYGAACQCCGGTAKPLGNLCTWITSNRGRNFLLWN